jgi:hypothetical protein
LPLLIKPRRFDNKNCEHYRFSDLLNKYCSVKMIQTSDFTYTYRITDKLEFQQFCNEYLYTLFNLHHNKTDFNGYPNSLSN